MLVLLGCYWPGHEATGPNQSFDAMARAFASEYRFRVVARANENATQLVGSWHHRELADCRYCAVGPLGARGLREIIRSTPHDVLMLNGFFDREFTIPALMMRRFGLVPRRPTILLPHGEFSAGPAALAKPHKRLYLKAARAFGLIDDVILNVTAESEERDIHRLCPWAQNVVLAPTIRDLGEAVEAPDFAARHGQPLRLVFLSRIDRKKNLHYALDVLADLAMPVSFDIYGPVTHEDYWHSCQERIHVLPAHVKVAYKGTIPNSAVTATLRGYDAFLLPTEGENFGHAIVDALAVGLPVIISDQTPWTGLEQHGAGWSLPLASPRAFGAAIERLAAMRPDQRQAISRGARQFIVEAMRASDAVAGNKQLLEQAIAGQTSGGGPA